MNKLPIFLGNWKMNVLAFDASTFCSTLLGLLTAEDRERTRVGIAPSFLAIPEASLCLGIDSPLLLGAQNVHWLSHGAHTGEVSPAMLGEFRVAFAIVGHSERRQFYGETSACVAKRAKAALEAGIIPVVCVGESEAEYTAGKSVAVVTQQLQSSLEGLGADCCDRLLVAYEPVWAIGTGKTATPEIARDMHAQIREELCRQFGAECGNMISILYGGSTKPENIEELLREPNVEGALVGGASLDAETFYQLIKNGRKARP